MNSRLESETRPVSISCEILNETIHIIMNTGITIN